MCVFRMEGFEEVIKKIRKQFSWVWMGGDLWTILIIYTSGWFKKKKQTEETMFLKQ